MALFVTLAPGSSQKPTAKVSSGAWERVSLISGEKALTRPAFLAQGAGSGGGEA